MSNPSISNDLVGEAVSFLSLKYRHQWNHITIWETLKKLGILHHSKTEDILSIHKTYYFFADNIKAPFCYVHSFTPQGVVL